MDLFATRPFLRSTMLIMPFAAFALALTAACVFARSAPPSEAQGIAHRMPTPPNSAQNDADKTNPPPQPNARAARRAQLVRDEKEFREGVERLYQLTAELRQDVQQTPTSAVLSVPMVKKAEAIEKLAKQLKNKAKGG